MLVVGIGASAGGLGPLKTFFSGVPRDTGMSFVVITHLHPDSESALTELIGREAAIAVEIIDDDVKLEPDTAYVLTPGYEAMVFNGRLQRERVSERSHPPAPINRFFRSLAQDQREFAVGIVLSGSGTDGTIGVEEIKGNLGMTIALDPIIAEYPGMPRSAVDSGYIDHAVSVEEMPSLLAEYRDRVVKTPDGDELNDSDRSGLNRILAIVRSETGHDFSSYKTSTMFRRIRRRMNVQQVESFDDYAAYLKRTPREANQLFGELLIGVTSFFRDPDVFDALRDEGLPQLFGEKEPTEIRAWVPGCSTGEEAYSLAIVLHEYCAERGIAPEIAIFGTDVSSEAISRARRGTYPDSIGADVGADRLATHFEREGDSYRVRKHIRSMLVFSEQDVTGDPPFTRLDLVSCRNLLIYLNSDMQARLVPLFHYSLRDPGLLVLGTSETVGGHQELFRPVNKKAKLFRKRPDKHTRPGGLDFALRRTEAERKQEGTVRERRRSLEERMKSYLLDHHAPPAVFVSRRNEIVYIHGRTGKFLEPATGEARMNVMDMAREGLAIPLGTALHESFRTESPVQRLGIRVKTNGDYAIVDLEVHPYPEETEASDLGVILFHERPAPEPGAEEGARGAPRTDKDEYVQHLEEELQAARERLQTTVEELETTNEELKSALEESQSTNEELQSSNEELESSKEEM
ncbi:MAG: CheR family methyltransferase, partial [Spirochaetota bacterium]